MLCKIPIIKNEVKSDDPPELRNGNGMPVTGARPIFIPMLTIIWKKNVEAIPIERR